MMSHNDLENAGAIAEELLIGAGVFANRSVKTRRWLGCLGCRWKGSGGNANGAAIARCSGADPSNVFRGLERLAAQKLASKTDTPPDGHKQHNRQLFYEPTSSPLGKLLVAALKVPDHCADQ